MIDNQKNNRIHNSVLPRGFCTVFIMLPDKIKIQSKMNNISRLDARITLPTDEYPINDLLKKNVSIHFPLLNMIATGTCVHAEKKEIFMERFYYEN